MGSKIYGKPKKETPKAAITEAEVDELLSAAVEESAPVEEAVETALEELTSPMAVVELTPEVASTVHTAYNTYFNSTIKKFVLVQLEYNPETKECRYISEIENGDNLAVAMHKLTNIMALKLVRGEEIK